MREIILKQTNVGVTVPVPMDQYQSPFNVGFGIVVNSGTPTYTVQHTFDDVFAVGYNPATGNWFNHTDVVGEIGVNADGNYAFPVSAIRLNVSAVVAPTDAATIYIKQAGVQG